MSIFSHLDPGFFADRSANFATESVRATGLAPGDRYWAKRNGPACVLTCREHNTDRGWVHPVENAYSYDDWECYRELKAASVAQAALPAEASGEWH